MGEHGGGGDDDGMGGDINTMFGLRQRGRKGEFELNFYC